MVEDTSNKTYVRPDNTAVLTCPHCNRKKVVPVDSFRGKKIALKIKCACKEIFTVNLEFRKRARKKTNLKGVYINHSQHDRRGAIVVKNLSLSGLEFASLDVQIFKVDDELTLEFTLDDKQQSQIRKTAFVRDVRVSTVGCEFLRSGEYAFDGALGFYVMS